jgi:hypothetical protein
VIPLKAIADGVGVVTMLYGRPWESAVKPVRQVSIEAKQLKDMLDLTDPMP